MNKRIKIKLLFLVTSISLIGCFNKKEIVPQKFNFDSSLPKGFIEENEKSTIFLSGETHSISINQDLFYHTFTKLNNNLGVNNLVFELPHSSVLLYREKLIEGNLDSLKSYPFIEQFQALNKKEIIRKIKNRKINLFGLDVEYMPYHSIKRLLMFIDDTTSDEYKVIENFKNRLNKFYNTEKSIIKDSLIVNEYFDWAIKTEDFKLLFGNNFIDVKLIHNGLIHYFKSKLFTTQENMMYRDSGMFLGFKLLKKEKEKYFGQFGAMHVHKGKMGYNYNFKDSLRTYWNNEFGLGCLLTKNKINYKSIIYFYNGFKAYRYDRKINKEGKVPDFHPLPKKAYTFVLEELTKVNSNLIFKTTDSVFNEDYFNNAYDYVIGVSKTR